MISRIIFLTAVCLMIVAGLTFNGKLFLFAWLGLIPLATCEEIVRVVKAGGGPPCRRAGIIANQHVPAQSRTDTGG